MTTSADAPFLTEQTIHALSTRANEPAWLLERRLEALRAFEAMSMPDPLDEEWRRTDISGFDLAAAMASDGTLSAKLVADGLPQNVVFTDLSAAATSHEALVKEHLHSIVRPAEWKLGALQAAGWQNGAFLYVPRGVEVEVPLTYELTGSGSQLRPHLLIVAEAGSSVTVLQNVQSSDGGEQMLVSGAVEIVMRQDSRVRFVELQGWGKNVFNFSTVRAHLERGAELTAGLVGLGGRLTKTKLEAELLGEAARAELLGLTFGDGTQHFDFVTLQDHVAPRTTSDLLFKAALDEASSEVWYGTVRIQKGAAGSDASQASRNLLLSNESRAAPIPVLEIEAYDIQRCSHGASAGPLDEEQRFYLEARGIPPADAERLLVDAFFQEVIDRLPDDSIRDKAFRALAAKTGADPDGNGF